MESRKTNRADLERKRPVFFQLGLIIAISAALAAFEWKTPDHSSTILPPMIDMEPDEEIINTFYKKEPELPRPKVTTFFNEVENTDENSDDNIIITESTPIDYLKLVKLPINQPEETDPGAEDFFVIVENMPVFPGGEAALFQYLALNIKYPDAAKEANISGTAFITFIIEPDGSVSTVKVLRGLAGGCSEEAVRVVQEMPEWTPGKQRGNPVRVRMNLPVQFKLI